MEINTIRDYNKLFAAIDKQGTPAYFSGSRFIGVVRMFDPTFSDYKQYIDYRNANGLSTSRKNYYYDILMSFEESIRNQIMQAIWEEAETAAASNLSPKEELFPFVDFNFSTPAQPVKMEEVKGPTVFISYSWDNEEHKSWVLKLVNKLFEHGVNVLLDVYELNPGRNMIHFMEESLRKADKVLIIFTPNYKLKSEKREGGVGYEYSILNIDFYRTITTNSKYIPVLKEGTIENSVPNFMQQFIAINMTSEDRFESKFSELLLSVYNKPQIEKPVLGKQPDFIKK